MSGKAAIYIADPFMMPAPFVSIGVTVLTSAARAGSPGPATRTEVLASAFCSSIIILSGFVFGIIALFGIRRYEKAGILWKGVAGILIVMFLALAAVPNVLYGKQKALERYEQKYGHPPP